MMIETQGETLTTIETQVESTVVDLEQGNKDIDRAIVSAKATRAVSRFIHFFFVFTEPYISYRKNGAALLLQSSLRL